MATAAVLAEVLVAKYSARLPLYTRRSLRATASISIA
jgi:transposase